MPHLKKLMPDLLLICGAVSVSFGISMIYLPAGFIAAGLLAIVAGMKLAKVA